MVGKQGVLFWMSRPPRNGGLLDTWNITRMACNILIRFFLQDLRL